MQYEILHGIWSQGSKWQFIIQNEIELLPQSNCTATKCIIIDESSNQILMSQTHRGWELPGGHIEQGETLRSTTVREIYEETGYTIQDSNKLQLLGHIKVTNIIARINKSTGESYPNPSYIPYFLCTNQTVICSNNPSGEDALKAGLFSITDTEIVTSEHYNIILLGLMKYLSTKS